MPLINCKVELTLNWYTNCVTIIGNGTAATFTITDTKLYIPIGTLKTEENTKLSKLLNEEFKRSVYLNHYKIFLKDYAANENIRERLDASFQGVSKLLVLAYERGGDNFVNEEAFNKYFFQKLKLKNTTLKLRVEMFMFKQLMIRLNNTMK